MSSWAIYASKLLIDGDDVAWASPTGRQDILRLSLRVRPLGADYLLFLVSADLRLLDLCRLQRGHRGIQGFPLSEAIDLARTAGAVGMFIVQERPPGDEVIRPVNIELTTSVRQMLEETGIEFLDHFLLVGAKILSVGGLTIDPHRQLFSRG